MKIMKYLFNNKKMKKNIVIFEVAWGNDKWEDWHRKDTIPIVEALAKKWWKSEIIFFDDEKKDEIFEYCKDKFDWYLSRVNPGNLKFWEKKYFETLNKLSDYWLVWMSKPEQMINYGAKDVLVKLKKTDLVPQDTFAYYSLDDLKNNFTKTLKTGERVLKQNRGSTGTGIWKVSVIDQRDFSNQDFLPLDTKIKLTEAVDNHIDYKTLGEFIDFCEQYLVWENAMIVDMKFLPRIKEWEIRVLYIWEEPIFVVHKKPAEQENAFSATLFSGAKYNYFEPEKYRELIEKFSINLKTIKNILGNFDTPVIWTADFILDFDENWKDKYILWEINCSCVWFTTHLNNWIQEKIANQIIKNIENNLK